MILRIYRNESALIELDGSVDIIPCPRIDYGGWVILLHNKLANKR